jgi:hypothetical protein
MMSEQADVSTIAPITEYQCTTLVCNVDRQYRSVVFCFGASGVGKTIATRHSARWDVAGALVSGSGIVPPPNASPDRPIFRTVFYPPRVTDTPELGYRVDSGR